MLTNLRAHRRLTICTWRKWRWRRLRRKTDLGSDISKWKIQINTYRAYKAEEESQKPVTDAQKLQKDKERGELHRTLCPREKVNAKRSWKFVRSKLRSNIRSKGEKAVAKNYRLVSLTCACCKVIETLVRERIMWHMLSSKLDRKADLIYWMTINRTSAT